MVDPMKKILVIVGSRDLDQEQLTHAMIIIEDILNTHPPEDWYVVSGHAYGIDRLAEDLAFERGYECYPIQAQWMSSGQYDPAAGHKRNSFMVAIADKVYVIWNGISKGSKDTLIKATKRGNLAQEYIV